MADFQPTVTAIVPVMSELPVFPALAGFALSLTGRVVVPRCRGTVMV